MHYSSLVQTVQKDSYIGVNNLEHTRVSYIYYSYACCALCNFFYSSAPACDIFLSNSFYTFPDSTVPLSCFCFKLISLFVSSFVLAFITSFTSCSLTFTYSQQMYLRIHCYFVSFYLYIYNVDFRKLYETKSKMH